MVMVTYTDILDRFVRRGHRAVRGWNNFVATPCRAEPVELVLGSIGAATDRDVCNLLCAAGRRQNSERSCSGGATGLALGSTRFVGIYGLTKRLTKAYGEVVDITKRSAGPSGQGDPGIRTQVLQGSGNNGLRPV